MTQRRRATAKSPNVPRTGKGRTTVRTKTASAGRFAKTPIRVSRTTERVGREIIADRNEVLRELADR